MNLTHLTSLLAVVDTGSFRLAAERLAISQPAVSQHIQKLEESLGARLVERRSGNCIATPEASEFIRHARSLLFVAERARRSLLGKELIVGASSNVGIYLIQPYFKRFLKQSDGVGTLEIAPNPVVAEKLRSGEIDVAAMEWWDGSDTSRFYSQVWLEEDLILIVGAAHRWAGRRSIRPEALAEEPILGGETATGTGRILRDRLGTIANDLRVTHTLGSTEAVKEGVKAGLGISLVLRSCVQEELAAGSLHEVRLRGVSLRKSIHLVSGGSLPANSLPVRFCNSLLAA